MAAFAEIAAFVVAVTNLIVGAWGGWLWWRVEPATAWWPALRATQILCGLFAIAAGVLSTTAAAATPANIRRRKTPSM